MEGVSDLYRFWGKGPEHFDTDLLVAFFGTLPDEASTRRSADGYKVTSATMLIARLNDLLQSIGMSMGGKKLSESKMLTTGLLTEERKDESTFSRLRKKEKARIENERADKAALEADNGETESESSGSLLS